MSGGLGSLFFFFKQKTAYEVRISDWSSDVCASDLGGLSRGQEAARADYLASAAAASGARIAVAAQTADTYIAIRGLQSRIAIATEQIETQRKLVDLVRLQYQKGVAAELQLRQAEGAFAQVAADRASVVSGRTVSVRVGLWGPRTLK